MAKKFSFHIKKERQIPLSDVRRVTVLGGYGKAGQEEPVGEVEYEMGQVVSVVGPTGSGKTALIKDIELFANVDTPSRRKVLVNGWCCRRHVKEKSLKLLCLNVVLRSRNR